MKILDNNAILRIVTHQAENVETLTVYGSLTGKRADELAAAWKSVRAEGEDRAYVIDLTEVTTIDERGEQVLIEMMRESARFVVRGFYCTSVLESLSARCNREA